MHTGKPGVSSYDKFSIGSVIKSGIRTAGNMLGLNSSLMKLSNGDDDSSASLDPTIGAREVRNITRRQIGKTVSSTSGGLGPTSTPARTANMLGNPYMRRYEAPGATNSYNFGLKGSPGIGQYYDVYESEENHLRFMDDTVGRDLLGYTHLENAASERSEEALNDSLYINGTYNIFGDLLNPFDPHDIEVFKFGPRRYSPTEPYALAPLDSELVRRTMQGNVQGFKERFEAVTDDRPLYTGSLIDSWDFMGSHYYLNLLNGVAEHGLYVENYEYDERHRFGVYERDEIPQSDYVYFLDVDSSSPDKEVKGLLNKTNRMFYEGKIRSLANRFATLNHNNEGAPDFLNTATDHVYGLSRGRNLRKLDLTYENGYPNPYCRVWTTHYQYSKYKDLIRGNWHTEKNAGPEHLTLHTEDKLMRPNRGFERLKKMTSLDIENGRPVFTPYYVDNRDVLNADSIKKCMFSIENLAWKDIIPDTTLIRKDENAKAIDSDEFSVGKSTTEYKVFNAKGFGMTLTPEQRGPNGGRIMWFPPYNLKFNEITRANWQSNDFIGRGEKIYTYVNSERTGSLSFTVLVDHPSIINEWARGGKMGKTANKTSPLSKDEMILRYFAGCDSLEFNPRGEYDVPYSTITTTTDEEVPMSITETVVADTYSVPRTSIVPKETGEADMTFYSVFYFPNDYSAEDFNKGTKSGGGLAGLNEMFEKGNRQGGGVGYELGRGGTGMTYDGKYYYKGPDKNGKIREWYYPVDNRVNNEVLTNADRYKDMTDFGLNASVYGTFWDSVPSGDKIKEYLNNGNTGITETENLKNAKAIISISDKVENKYFIPAYNFFKNLKQMITVLDEATENLYTYEISIQGYASSHGYVQSNKTLAENRAAVIESWIKGLNIFTFDGEKKNATISHNGNGQLENTGTKTESDFRPKAARAALVTLSLIPKKTILTEITEYDEIPIYEDRVASSWTETNTTIEQSEEYDTSKSDDYENQTYDNEYTYFKQISENDDMVRRYISDKVDYFDPAFHSITPEGFNARLTFLQQCTRQGPTISASDRNGGSTFGAGNLSFGRAPFCILRIGDFFNTKICIDNINIDYGVAGGPANGPTWDLNPEGIGLQPMFANVTIQFTFLGGSDISGPIARLQNAVSFNYYANTSVYDRRADYRNGFVTEKDDAAYTWSPLMLNKNDKANVTEHKKFFTRTPKPGEEGKINEDF